MATSDGPPNVSNVTLSVARAAQAAVNGLTLAASNYVSRKLDMIPVYPVNDAEPDRPSEAYSIAKNARPGLKYEVPIVVAFGAYPFNARKIAGPSWLTVNSALTLANGVYTEPEDYMTITGTPPTGSEGTYTVTVGVTDQDYQRGANPSSELQISYTLTVSNTMHVFVAPVATGAGDGSSPTDCADYSGLYTTKSAAGFGQGKITVWRGGSYVNPWTEIDAAIRPANHSIVHIAYPGEVPDLDLLGASGAISCEGNDLLFKNFLFRNGMDKAFAFFLGTGTNSGFWRCSFRNFQRSDNSSTNQSAWYIGSNTPEPKRRRMFMRECDFEDLGDVSSYIWYSTKDTVIERNTFTNPIAATTRSVVFPKSDNTTHSIRRNRLIYPSIAVATSAQAFQIYNSVFYSGEPELQKEICYNQIFIGSGNAFGIGQSDTSSGTDNWSYRNTYVGGGVGIPSDPADGGFSENDVIQNSQGGVTTYGDASNVTGAEAHGISGIVDSQTGLITGALRSQYLGKRGHEIAGESV